MFNEYNNNASRRCVGVYVSDFNDRILKSNLSWSPTWAKFCQLVASLSVVLPLTKLKLEYRMSGIKCKKKEIKTNEKHLHHSISIF